MSDKTDNEIIAEFMGLYSVEPHTKHNGSTYSVRSWWRKLEKKPDEKKYEYKSEWVGYSDSFKYDTSFDALHPVLCEIAERLDDLKNEHGISPDFKGDEYEHPWEIPIISPIYDVHSAAVNLIKFLNSNKQP